MTAQQLSRHGIGASEAAAALGMHPYVSPIALWERKRAELQGAPQTPMPDTDAIRWGNYLEQPIRQAYADLTGEVISTPKTSMFHAEHSWRRATPDGLVIRHEPAPEKISRGVEVKTANIRLAHLWGESGTDEVPEHYLIQCLWSMHVLDVERWDVAALIGGADFRVYLIGRDAELEENLVERVDSFWNENVIGNVPPQIDHSADYRDYLARRYPAAAGEIVAADEEATKLVSSIRDLKKTIKADTELLDLYKNHLRAKMGTATELETELGRVTYRQGKGRRKTNWKAICDSLLLALSSWQTTKKDGDGPAKLTRDDIAGLIEKNTETGKGTRPLCFPRSWGTEPEGDES